jgi:hypothetical protein
MYAVREAKYLLRSADGLSWRTFAGPFEDIGQYIWWAGRPKGKDYVLVAGEERICKIDGETGKRLGSVKVPDNMQELFSPYVFDPFNPETLLIGTDKGQIIRYEADSNKFTEIFPAKSDNEPVYITGIAFDPGRKGRVFAGLADGTIQVSGDSGKTWKKMEPEFPSTLVRKMLITGRRKLVVAGIGAVYALDLSKLGE